MTPRRAGRWWALGAAILFGIAAPGAVPLAAQEPALAAADTLEPEIMLLDVNYGRGLARTLEVLRRGDVALLPMRALLEAFEIRVEPGDGQRVRGHWYPRDEAIDLTPTRLTVGPRTITPPPGVVLSDSVDVYVPTTLLTELFGWPWRVDWSGLSAIIADQSMVQDLPVNRRLARARARRIFIDTRGLEPAPDTVVHTPWALARGLAVDYDLSLPLRDVRNAGLSLGVGSEILGGAGRLRVAGDRESITGTPSWMLGRPRSEVLTQIRLGSLGSANSLVSQGLDHGVLLSNLPLITPRLIGTASYAGTIEPGWEVEAWQGGRLVALDTADAKGAFDVTLPIGYGDNNVRFTAYGPAGEIRDFDRSRRVPLEMVPEGALWWSGSAGTCPQPERCRGLGTLDLQTGVTQRLTVNGGVDVWLDPQGFRQTWPYLGVTAAPLRSLIVQGGVMPGAMATASVRLDPYRRLTLSATGRRSLVDAAQLDATLVPYVTPGQIGSVMATGSWTVSEERGIFSTGIYQRVEATSSTVEQGTVRLGGTIGRVQLAPYVRHSRTRSARGAGQDQTRLGVSIFAPLPRLFGAGSTPTFSASIETDSLPVPRSITLGFSQTLRRSLYLTLGAQWADVTRESRPRIQIGVTGLLPSVRWTSGMVAPPGSDPDVRGTVGGSAIWDAATRRVLLDNVPSSLRAGVTGRVYVDENSNGRYDDGEETMPGVGLRVGGTTVVTDDDGRYRTSLLQPFQRTLVTVDSSSLASMTAVPTFLRAEVIAPPARFATVDVPLVQGGSLEGEVVRALAGGDTVAFPTAGEVLLVHESSGLVLRQPLFSDGTFLITSVRPGRWRLTLAPELLALYGAPVREIRFEIGTSVEGTNLTGLRVIMGTGGAESIEPLVLPPPAPPAAPPATPPDGER